MFATPGNRPFASLAHVLAPELAGDADAVARLLDFEQPGVALDVVSRWRRRHDQALLVIDQFEELFTQSPDDVQERFARLLASLALEADVHVLLSMRDDFLFHCQRFESLAPLFSELTVIGPPTGAALRRALVQPAVKCGYRFEDEAMVDEMLAEVAGERGALPLVAFAMARLWESRDRERGLLTREALPGDRRRGRRPRPARRGDARRHRPGSRADRPRAAAQPRHRAGHARHDRTRRAAVGVRGRRRARQAAEVLDALVDARLLTAYEIESPERRCAPAGGSRSSTSRC